MARCSAAELRTTGRGTAGRPPNYPSWLSSMSAMPRSAWPSRFLSCPWNCWAGYQPAGKRERQPKRGAEFKFGDPAPSLSHTSPG